MGYVSYVPWPGHGIFAETSRVHPMAQPFFCADEIDLIDFNRLFFEYDLGQTLDLRFGYFNIL